LPHEPRVGEGFVREEAQYSGATARKQSFAWNGASAVALTAAERQPSSTPSRRSRNCLRSRPPV
jgi:hypothetical protein